MNLSRWAPAVVAAALVAVGVTGCNGSSSSPGGRLIVDGQAELNRPGQDRREVTGSRDIQVGDRVRIRQGAAEIRLPGSRRLELRTGSDVELQAAPGDTRARPTLLAGDLLVRSGSETFAIGVTGAEVAVQGDARISRGVALLVATYKGSAQLTANGSTVTVPALRQVALPATGTIPSAVSPLEPAPADSWDQRYLSGAIELGNELRSRSEGYTAQLGATEGRSLNSFRELLPGLAAEPSFTAGLLTPARSPGETLVGAAITLEGKRGAFVERWASAFAFRDQGAPWGLVALDQDVDRAPLLALIESAISRGPTSFALGPPAGAPRLLTPNPGGLPPTTVVPVTTSTTVRPRTTATTPTVARPGSSTTTTTLTGPLNTGAPLVDNTVNSLVTTLTGLLRSLGQL